MSRYIPPHLRNKAPAKETQTKPQDVETQIEPTRRALSDLQTEASNTTWRLKVDRDDRTDRPLHTLNEIHVHYNNQSGVHSTLNESPQNPGKLGYIVLFRGANPRWQKDHIIFAKTNVGLVPGYENKTKPDTKTTSENNTEVTKEHAASEVGNASQKQEHAAANSSDNRQNIVVESASDVQSLSSPSQIKAEAKIPVFLEIMNRAKHTTRKFLFYDYWDVAHVEFLAPRSPELVRMLQQKWEISQERSNGWRPPNVKQRDPEAWEQSLRQEWAVIQLKRVEDTEGALKDPEIKEMEEESPDSKRGLRNERERPQAEATSGSDYKHEDASTPVPENETRKSTCETTIQPKHDVQDDI